MAIQARKERQLRERQELFLRVAREILLARGYHGLTMDRIARAAEYSKGTTYLHFGCKEDVVLALATDCLERRLGMFERAATFRGRPRERMAAIGEAVELFARLYPSDLRILEILNAQAVNEKASEKYKSAFKTAVARGLDVMVGVVRDAIAQGDLVLDPETGPEELAFGLWAITDGGYAVILSSLYEIGLADPFATVMKSCHILGDGYGWRPLSTEWDYEETRDRIRREIFPEEARQIYGV